jgi:hypothetical protein
MAFVGNARAQAGVWPSSVIVRGPGTQRHPEMTLVQQNHEIEALSKVDSNPIAHRVRRKRQQLPPW